MTETSTLIKLEKFCRGGECDVLEIEIVVS